MKKFTILSLVITMSVLFSGNSLAQNSVSVAHDVPGTVYHPTLVGQAVYFDVIPSMKEQVKTYSAIRNKSSEEREIKNNVNPNYDRYGHHPYLLPEDPVWQKQDGTYLPQSSSPLQNFDGITNLDNVYPPDTQGDVSNDKYVQVVNCHWAVYSKTGTTLLGPSALSTIWAGMPAPWNNINDGDPIVLWDQAAQRWVISQFALPSTTNNAELVAVSQTSDPTGAWYRYVFTFGNQMPDYPKLGVWSDGYYLSFNQFANQSSYSGVGVAVLDRTAMIAGNATASMQYINLGASADPWAMLPSDWDGATAPVAGEPNYFVYFNDWSSTSTQYLKIYSFHVDWTTPTNTTFTNTGSLTTAAFDSQICTATRGQCIPQPGTSIKLEDLADRLMYRVQYRNFGSYRTMVLNHTVDVDGTGHAGVRWYELRNSGSAWSIYQQGTFSPDASHRWVGSIAMNGNGDIALGYSVSDGSSVYPSIRYTGRRSTDPLGQMTVTEQSIIAGGGSQTGTGRRWGDYAMMSVDPSDDQTFWFTTEYMQTTSALSWKTRIASFKFSNNPTVATTAATSITTASATLNGTINPNGLASTYYFQWGTTTAYGTNTTTTSAGSGSTSVNVNAGISGLTAGTTYHYRIVGTNSDGTSYGNDMTVTPGAAVLTTTAASAITMTTATSGGNITSDGGAAVTARGVCWATTANPTITSPHTTDGSGTGTFTSNITGLSSNTVYHVRAYATNSAGTWYGDDKTFSTLCNVYTLPFNESFSGTTIPSCWTQVDHLSNGQVWQFGTITTGNPNPNLTGNYAYLNSDGYGSGGSQNADLVSPVIDCSAFSNVTLQFQHYFKSYTGSSGTLSYSINGGSSWTTLQTFTATSASNPTTYNQVITAAAGQSQVQFRWNYTGAYGWYWAFDNVQVTGTSTQTLTVTPSNQNVPATPAGTTTFNVASSTSWSASSNQTWCTVTPSGTGTGTITATYQVNNNVGSRVATITVTGSGAPTNTVTVTQAGVPATLSVSPANQNVPASPAGSTTFNVTSNTSWTVVSDSAWCTVTPSGSGNGTITANYGANPYTITRIAHITVTVASLAPVVVTVTQSPAPPSLSVTPPNQNVPATPQGATTFTVTGNVSWTASSNSSWCTVTPSGSGNGYLTATYQENTSTASRVATITVSGSAGLTAVVTVTQDAALPTVSVSPSNQNVPATPAGYTTFNVTSNTSWTVSSDQTWCVVPPTGTGSTPFNATYDQNLSTSSRVANITVTVTGLTPVVVTVTQSGTNPTLTVTPANQNVGYMPANTTFTVVSNSSWTASSDSAWCSVTPSGTGSGTIDASILQNPFYVSRIATITVTVAGIAPQMVTVTQAPSTVSVVEHEGNKVRIIPNPAKGSFRIETGLAWKFPVEVLISDLTGRAILSRTCRDKNDLQFDLSAFPEGSYFVRVASGGEELTQKLILLH